MKEIEQAKYKAVFDQTHKDIQFNIGDQVWVYFGQPRARKTQNLLPRFEGPFTVIHRLDSNTYRVQKDNKLIVAHVQRLLRFHKWES